MIPRPNPKAVDRRGRLALPDVEPPVRKPAQRVRDFREVFEPWSLDHAVAAARRCIQCPSAPCVKACPLETDIPYALWLLEHGELADAAAVFGSTNPLAAICGRVCPQTELCEGACPYAKQGRIPVSIGRLEAFAVDRAPLPTRETPDRSGHRAAIVGAGPAGLTVADILAARGHEITVFDAWPTGGGILTYGIPSFKMSHSLVRELVERLAELGVLFRFGTRLGRDLTIDELFQGGFGAVFLGFGSGVERRPSIPGSDLPGVLRATPFLVRANVARARRPAWLGEAPTVGRRVAVIGGGDTAMDCVRTALRLGATEVSCWYRRTEAEMPGNPRDRGLAREEGARFHWLCQPTRFEPGDRGQLKAMECVRTELSEPDPSGRRRPGPIAGSAFTVEVDTAILALGYEPDRETVQRVEDLQTDANGRIVIDPETGSTSIEGVFAGGDAVLGPALVVHAVAQARTAAEAMHRWLAGATARAAGTGGLD